MPREVWGKGNVYKVARERLRIVATLKELLDLPLQFRKRGIHCRAPGIEHNFPLRIQPIEPEANRFPDTPLDSVPNNGTAKRAWNRESDSRAGAAGQAFGIRAARVERREERAGVAGALFIHSPEIFGS